MAAIAFFDLDRTLIGINSATRWIRREVRLGHISWRQAARGGGYIVMYQAGFSRMEKVLRDAVLTLEGTLEDDLQARSATFWAEEVAAHVRPGALRAIAVHREAGDRLALLTTSSCYIGDAAAEALGLDEVLSNRFEVIDGRFTGRPIEPMCFGTGKRTYAEQLAQKYNISLDDCAFYTDSYSDLPALEVVGRPVVVHPDPRLARLARKRGWVIEDWDR
ncbi:MAG: HAD superfamily hydrolase (TIGR01490 family) [Myxococcota bacterium]